MESDLSFGAWLKRRRKALDITQKELADQIGCSASAIYKIEAEERRPSRQIAELLAEQLEIPAADRAAFTRWARGERLPSKLPPLVPQETKLTPFSRPPEEAAAPPVHSRIPTPAAPIVGRERELAGIEQLLADPACRLLTLVGPGGIGKTRLALEIAHRRKDRYAQGVFFVPLASVDSSDFIIPAIADEMGMAFYGSETPLQQLIHYLQSRNVLLVLDNVEHLLGAADVLSEILQHSGEITLLVTSQKRLNLLGEWIFEVQGLPLPDYLPSGGRANSSAVRLFEENARRVRPDFSPSEADLNAMIRICRLLEGMPLGILLAATWVRTLSCREIAAELSRSLDFLRSTSADIPERQRSLRAVFNHAWSLLSDDEKQVLENLAVFKGDFRREAAETLAGASIFTLTTLVDKSLVRRIAEERYDLHELVRQFAFEQLGERRAGLLARHSEYFLLWMETQERELKSERQNVALQRISQAIDDVRQAWEWAVQNRQVENMGAALRGLMWYYELKGWLQEGGALFGWAAAELGWANPEHHLEPGSPESRVAGHLLTELSWFALRLGQFDRTQRLLDLARKLLAANELSPANAENQVYSGMTAYLVGNYPLAEDRLSQAIQLAREVGDLWCVGQALSSLGRVAQLSGNYPKAIQHYEASLQVWKRIGDVRGKTYAMNFLGNLKGILGEYNEAQAYLQDSLALSLEGEDAFSTGTAYNHLGLLAYAREDYGQAEEYFLAGWARFDEIGEQHSRAWVLCNLGHTQIAMGKDAQAEQVLLDALNYAWQAQVVPLILDTLAGLGHLDLRAGKLDSAEEKLSIASQHPVTSQTGRERAIRLLMDLVVQKPEAKFITPRPLEVVVAEIIPRTGTIQAYGEEAG